MSERFNITFKAGRYLVSIPNYKGGDVVDADVADAQAKSLGEMIAEFGSCEHKDCDCRACKIVRRARVALAKAST